MSKLRAQRSQGRPGQASSWLATPTLIFLILVILLPLLITVVYSFLSQPTLGTGVKWVFSTDAYRQIFVQEKLDGTTAFDTRYLKVLWNSFYYAGIATITTLILGIPVAMWIATRPVRFRAMLVLAVTLPFWTSVLIRTYAVRQILDETGPIGGFLKIIGVGNSYQILYTPWATIIGLTYTFIPFMILPVYASAERFDFRYAEAGYDLGAKRWTVLRRIVIPGIRPGIIAGIALVFIPGLGSFLQPDMLGGGKTNMIANVIANNFGQARNWPFGSALSVFLLIFTVLFVLMVTTGVRSRGDQVRLI